MEGDIVQMGAYIGAGLACTGMGGAAVGCGPCGRQLPLRCPEKPIRCSGPNSDHVYWYRICRSTGHLFVPGCSAAYVCRIIHRGNTPMGG